MRLAYSPPCHRALLKNSAPSAKNYTRFMFGTVGVNRQRRSRRPRQNIYGSQKFLDNNNKHDIIGEIFSFV